ncbi:MAG: enoyl-CoA hydratase/isomerase family protein [Planctomycetota bacterium]|jgi:methylglutaconyl-CoA hydratase
MIRLQKAAPSGTILIDAPATHNALSREMIQQLIDAFSDFHRDKSVRAIILSATGATFCSGANLKEWQTTSQELDALELWKEVADEIQELIESMLRLPKPIIAAVDGAALGLGLALVLASDLVVATKRASFAAPAPQRGLVSGMVSPLLMFRCGGSAAARILLGNESIDGDEAHRIHLVHRLVPSDLVWANANEWAKQIALSAQESVQMTKRLINEMIGENLLTHLATGAAVMATACSTEAAIEGLAAFSEKRPPKFP